MRTLAAVVALTLWSFCAPWTISPQSAQKRDEGSGSEVLVVGVYHMANPGRDIFNIDADDVLAPKRQADIAEVVAALKKFQPTKIAVERRVGDKRIVQDYGDYMAGKHELTRNEIEQIGFRLAKELGHNTIFPVDADGEFPLQHVVNYAKASGRTNELNELMDEIGAAVKEFDTYLHSQTVLQALLYMNSDAQVAQHVGFYYRQAQFGEPWDWAGADLLSAWVKRNLRIYSNVMRLVDSPNERVLLLYGAGHLGWLQRDFNSTPNIRLRRLAEFAK